MDVKNYIKKLLRIIFIISFILIILGIIINIHLLYFTYYPGFDTTDLKGEEHIQYQSAAKKQGLFGLVPNNISLYKNEITKIFFKVNNPLKENIYLKLNESKIISNGEPNKLIINFLEYKTNKKIGIKLEILTEKNLNPECNIIFFPMNHVIYPKSLEVLTFIIKADSCNKDQSFPLTFKIIGNNSQELFSEIVKVKIIEEENFYEKNSTIIKTIISILGILVLAYLIYWSFSK